LGRVGYLMLRDGNLEIKGKFQELNSKDVLKIL
jgi:hypothetical protein